MPYRQVVSPKFDLGTHFWYAAYNRWQSYLGWCLKWMDDGVNAPSRTPSAKAAYERQLNAGNIRHEELPVGVWVPTYYGFTTGPYTQLGHCAWAYNHGSWIELRDSEVGGGARGIYRSFAELLAWFGVYRPTYLGWSTWIDGVKVVEEYGNQPSRSMDSIVNSGLALNQGLISQNGQYTAIHQWDGNFVVYDRGRAIWATNTSKGGSTNLMMQKDGNLVMYTKNGTPIWSSNSQGKGGYRLIIQNDGNLVIYTADNRPIWASKG